MANMGSLEVLDGSTETDAKDMKRLGKHQEFRVRFDFENEFSAFLMPRLEKFPIPVNSWFYLDFPFHLGICPTVRSCITGSLKRSSYDKLIERRFAQWWIWRPLLGLHWHGDLLLLGCLIACRNGVYVSPCSEIGALDKSRQTDPCRAPTSGGQYHWISEFAPPAYQKLASYISGREQ